MGVSPFSRALLIAACVHFAIFGQLRMRRCQPRRKRPPNPRHEFHVELEFGAAATNDALRNTATALDPVAPPNSWNRSGPVARAATAPVPRVEQADPPTRVDPNPPSELSGPGATVSDGLIRPSTLTTEQKINLGLNGDLLRMLDAQRAANPVHLPQKRARRIDAGAELTRRLTAAILTEDLRHGHARGNALLGALDSALRHSGPTRGQAIIRVTVNASGEVTGVELIRGEDDDWSAVLRAFGQAARNKRVRVPSGTAGLRITFSVSAKVQRPSGKEIESAPAGVASPSMAPDGLTMNGTFDLADLSNKSARMLAVRIVNEELL